MARRPSVAASKSAMKSAPVSRQSEIVELATPCHACSSALPIATRKHYPRSNPSIRLLRGDTVERFEVLDEGTVGLQELYVGTILLQLALRLELRVLFSTESGETPSL